MPTRKVNAWYGWVPDRPDYRDKLYTAIAAPPKKLPPKVDLSAGCSRPFVVVNEQPAQIALQYNPDTLTRRLQIRVLEMGTQ